ncbi:MAG: DUF192 domain-containing protein [Cyanobacteria bacterium RI_101]|nr:DUF192 domain-containing protein [Cyanobacteria bacterium RI_101]
MLPKRRWLLGVIVPALLAGCGLLWSPDSESRESAQALPVTAELVLGETVIELEVARTPEEQAQGLMFRSELPPQRGMLFDFDSPRVARFWMKNTLIPLDMIFLRQGEIKAVLSKIPPCDLDPCPVYGPWEEVDQVLELGAGEAARLGLEPGARLKIRPR